MRLSEKARALFKEIVARKDPQAELYLYGSRVDDALRGGDIDFLIVSERLKLRDKLDILVQMKDALGDQKIDILIRTAQESRADPFVRKIIESARRL